MLSTFPCWRWLLLCEQQGIQPSPYGPYARKPIRFATIYRIINAICFEKKFSKTFLFIPRLKCVVFAGSTSEIWRHVANVGSSSTFIRMGTPGQIVQTIDRSWTQIYRDRAWSCTPSHRADTHSSTLDCLYRHYSIVFDLQKKQFFAIAAVLSHSVVRKKTVKL